MTNLNSIKNKISRKDRKVSINNPSILLAVLFNSVVTKFDEVFVNES